jgi:hypothetical protein
LQKKGPSGIDGIARSIQNIQKRPTSKDGKQKLQKQSLQQIQSFPRSYRTRNDSQAFYKKEQTI